MFFTMSREGGMAINLPAQLLNLISHICGTARPIRLPMFPQTVFCWARAVQRGGGGRFHQPPPLVKLRVEMYTPVDFYKFKNAYQSKLIKFLSCIPRRLQYSQASQVFLGKSSIPRLFQYFMTSLFLGKSSMLRQAQYF